MSCLCSAIVIGRNACSSLDTSNKKANWFLIYSKAYYGKFKIHMKVYNKYFTGWKIFFITSNNASAYVEYLFVVNNTNT